MVCNIKWQNPYLLWRRWYLHHSCLSLNKVQIPSIPSTSDLKNRCNEKKWKSSDVTVMKSWLLSREEPGNKVLVLRPRGTPWLVPMMKGRAYLSCRGPNVRQVVRQQLAAEDYGDPGFALTPWYLAVQMYKGADVTVFKFHHLVLFHLFEFEHRDRDTSGHYQQETFWFKGIIQQKKTLNCSLPDAGNLSVHTCPALIVFPMHPVSTTVRNK